MFMALSGGLGQLNEVSVAILRYISCCLVHDIENKALFVTCYTFIDNTYIFKCGYVDLKG